MHEVFAALRVYQLGHVQKLHLHASNTADRIFGIKRWDEIREKVDWTQDRRTQMQQLAFEVLHTSGWYDDPQDNIRTMHNMELCAIQYIDEFMYAMDNYPIWVESERKPKGVVGIEQTFDVVCLFEDGKEIRYIGTIDGLVKDLVNKRLCLEENKTASRLDDGFKLSFDVRHQVTGYCAASTAVFGLPVYNARIFGVKIKPSNRGEDITVLPANRTPDSIMHWGRWIRHTVDMFERYEHDFENAPRYTHSCNRYFRPCSLVPFCSDSPEGRQEQFEQMVPAEASPSEKAVQEL